MKTKKIFLAILVFSFAFITCKKENIKEAEKSDYPIEIEVTKLDIGQSSCWENLEFDTIHIINSKDELYHYLPCKDDLNIDFSKYSLLVFNVKNCNADSYINELSLQQISVSKYLFTADIIPSATANAAPLIVSVLVPKIVGTDSIDLIIPCWREFATRA